MGEPARPGELAGEDARARLERLLREKAEAARSFELSFAQERLWFLEQLDPGRASYNIPAAVRLTGPLDVRALERAYDEVVRRHETLRTTFVEVDGRPRQRVAAVRASPLSVEDLTAIPAGSRAELTRRRAGEEARRPFDLARGPLVRLRLLRLGSTEHVLLLALHHIVSDGWSMGVLVREIALLYAAFSAGKPSPLGQLPVQYADFAHWQREWLTGELLERQLEYWSARLAGLGALELPFDRPRPAVQTSRGAQLSFQLASSTSDELDRLGREQGATPFMCLLAGFQVLLARHSGQEQIAVGSPIANRNRRELEGLIGFFVNTLVLRVDLSGDPTFREALARVRSACTEAYSHQDVPFEKLVERLAPERDLSRTPLFQAMFVLQNLPSVQLDLPGGVALEPLELETGAAKFDLTLSMVKREGTYRGTFEYNRDLFDAETISRLAHRLATLLDGVVAEPDRSVFDLPLLEREERRRVLVEWNETPRLDSAEACIHRVFERQAVLTPDALALLSGERAFSYRALDEWADRLARGLRERGVGPEDLVALCLSRSPAMIASLLGVLKAGGAYLPLDPDYPRERLAFMLQDAAPRLVLTERSLADLLDGTGAPLVSCEELEAGGSPADLAPVPADPRNLAYVIYTSGSTGRPKGTLLEHAGLSRLAAFHRRRLDIAPGERVLQFAALSYDASVWESFMALANGATLLLAASEDLLPGQDLLRVLREREITTVTLPPSVLALLPGAELPALRNVIVAGESCPAELVRRWAPGRRMYNAYGPTESTVCATIEGCSASEPGDPPIGRPIDGAEVYVLDRRLEPVPPGVPGELYIGGAGLARGYLGRPDLTAERFVPHPFSARAGERLYRTGDLCRWLRDGRVQFLGRIDHQVKLRGYRIELGEIEAALRRTPGVAQAVVLAREGRLVAYLVRSGAASVDVLRESLARELPEFMVPQVFVPLDALPLSPSGKVDLGALPAPDGRRRIERAFVAPRTPLEEQLARQWAELLRVERVGIHDGFFELGGHSLLATQLVSRVRESTGVDLPLRTLFERPTVAGLAAALELEERAEAAPIERLPQDGPLPLSFAQERLWFLDQLVPGGSFYNLPVAVRIEGALRFDLLERSFRAIVERHAVLRSSFASVEGQAVLRVSPEAQMSLRIADLSGVGAARREALVRELARREAHRPFQLAEGPLLRVSLLSESPHAHVLLLTVHHIVADGWSMGVLVRELAEIYSALAENRAARLGELSVQYADFAAWQRAWLGPERLGHLLGYWRGRLAGLPQLELPTDRPRPAVRTFRGATRTFALPAPLVRAVRHLAEREGATPFMVLLASFQLLLGRLAGQEDLAVGTPIAGRSRVEVEPLVGLFVNTLVLRADLSGDPSFLELLRRVREVSLESFAHQDLPFEKLVMDLAPERDLSRESLFQVMFTLQNLPPLQLDLPGGARLSPLEPEGGIAKFDLTLAISEGSSDWQGALEYNADLFDPATIETMAERFLRLLRGVVEGPERRLSALPLLSAGEYRRLLVEWGETPAPCAEPPVSLQFAEARARAPEAIAVAWEGGRRTYAELDRDSDALALRLRELGVSRETVVALCLDRSYPTIVAMLATMKAGAAYAPLAPDHPADRLGGILADLRPAVVIAARPLPVEPPPGARLLRVDEEQAPCAPAGPLPAPLPASLAYVIHTSGSTGRPKGVAVTHAALSNLVAWHRMVYRITPQDRATQIAALTFDAAVWEIWPYLAAGASVHFVPQAVRVEPAALPRFLAREGITVSFLPTPLHESISEDAWTPDSKLRLLLTGGDRLHRAPRSALPFELINHYGPTENAVVATSERVEASNAALAPPIGRPIAGVRVYVLDEQLSPVPPGAPGELYVAGASLARGYLHRPERTAESFLPDPFQREGGARMYRTGDRCRFRSDGRLEFLGRRDDQVKIRGVRIELGEVEAAFAAHPGVARVAVVARPAPGGGSRLVAFVEPASEIDFREYLRARLPEAMIPGSVAFLEALPLTAHGKIDRRALPHALEPAMRLERVEPRTEGEERMARVWSEVLDVPRVGATDNFFELGGHSLSAVRLAAAIEREFGRPVGVAALFQAPTVERLAALVEGAAGTFASEIAVELQGEGSRTPFFCVHQDTGLATSYTALAGRLGAGRPFYGLQSPDLLGDGEPCASVEAMGARYVQAVRSIQPSGPYLLGGHSFGGTVAFEMARQLVEAGESVRALALIDTSAPHRDPAMRARRFRYDDVQRLVSLAETVERFSGAALGLSAGELGPLAPAARYGLFLERVARSREAAPAEGKEAGLAPREVLDLLLAGGPALLERTLRVSRACTEAALAYAGRPYAGQVTLFRSEEVDPSLGEEERADPSLGWNAWCALAVEVRSVRGDHQSIITEPHVQELATCLGALFGDE